jgi:hypothetical protein
VDAAVPVATVDVRTARLVLALELQEVRVAAHRQADGCELEHAGAAEAGGIAFGVAFVAAEVVLGVEILDLDIVLGRNTTHVWHHFLL